MESEHTVDLYELSEHLVSSAFRRYSQMLRVPGRSASPTFGPPPGHRRGQRVRHGPGAATVEHLGDECLLTLRSNLPHMSTDELIAEFGIESMRDYLARVRRDRQRAAEGQAASRGAGGRAVRRVKQVASRGVGGGLGTASRAGGRVVCRVEEVASRTAVVSGACAARGHLCGGASAGGLLR